MRVLVWLLGRGLSPHTRGKLDYLVSSVQVEGPIPAYAGETSGD